ncbi:TPA: hypothetical protein U2D46_002026 [Streptococcus suis]|uniref:hypothetical protein n=1 Tax=Streptococcus suis TaxID=1307 RepID=UPI0006B432A7|nr:hypothetical protein [Streptococcus suis]AZR98252.1 hypothetical protein A7J10_10635 [Streptococcus suis]KPA68507.1 hypothetical protein XK27_02360 [Streptococcus suis]MCK3891336.1 hypothetical protein [Streptococcus suis]MCQ9286843.1 hypothetical protein [Streptococcus suis]MDW8731959.1 hypothetical protein [Streptococcus suis]
MALNIVVDIPETIGNVFKFKEFRNKKKFNSDEIVGTSIIVFDRFGNEHIVVIDKLAEKLSVLNTLKVFDDVEFQDLQGKVYGTSREDSTFVQLKLSLTAENLRKVD